MLGLDPSSEPTPASDARPAELKRRILTYEDLSPVEGAASAPRPPDRELDLSLEMVHGGREWFLNCAAFPDNYPLLMETRRAREPHHA